eukprot:6175355-Pleurochrysis_carterae.AAC.1
MRCGGVQGRHATLMDTPEGAAIPGFPHLCAGDSLEWLGMRVFVVLMAASGFRKADVALGAGVGFGRRHLSLFFVRWHVGGHCVELPEQGVTFTPADRVHIIPPPSKADPDGSRWAASQIVVRFSAHAPLNLVRYLAEYERRRNVLGEQVRGAPLLLDDRGQPWRKDRLLDAVFHAWLCLCFDEATAKKHSVHSFCIYLA